MTATSTANVVVGIIFIVLGLVLFIPGALATAGRLKGNGIVGLHVPEVRKDEEVWINAHKAAGPFFIFAGIALLFGAAFAFIAQGWLWVAPVIAVIIAVVAAAAGGNVGARAAKLFAQAKNEAPEPPAPAVDLGALRDAAKRADGQGGNLK